MIHILIELVLMIAEAVGAVKSKSDSEGQAAENQANGR